jgi:hypothetical protein
MRMRYPAWKMLLCRKKLEKDRRLFQYQRDRAEIGRLEDADWQIQRVL